MAKSRADKNVMKKFWARAGLVIASGELARYQGAWQNASTVAEARVAFESLWGSRRIRAGQPAPASVPARPRAV
eukprot:819076-Pyramimonas_sp.AAC.1